MPQSVTWHSAEQEDEWHLPQEIGTGKKADGEVVLVPTLCNLPTKNASFGARLPVVVSVTSHHCGLGTRRSHSEVIARLRMWEKEKERKRSAKLVLI
jgi:hypothetical protein